MDLQRLRNPVLRPQGSLILSFLVPFTSTSLRLARRGVVASAKSRNQPYQSLHSTTVLKAQSSSSSNADLDALEDFAQPNQATPSPTASSRRNGSGSQINALLRSAFDVPPPNRRRPYKPPEETSASIVRAGYKAAEYYSLRDSGARTPGSLARSMAFPVTPGSKTKSDIGTSMPMGGRLQAPTRAKRTIRSRPSIGRTVEINQDREVDFGRALRSLEIRCAVNRVRGDLQRQRYHERPGMKRKRLESERWRKLFRESFKATVGRVKEMRRKGW